MTKLHNAKILFVSFALVVVSITACVHNPPVPSRTMEVEKGRRAEAKSSQSYDNKIDKIVTTGVEKDEPKDNPEPHVSNVLALKPLTLDDIEYYLKNKVSSKLIASRIAERGVNFELTDKIKRRLKKVKADERVFKAINKANASIKGND